MIKKDGRTADVIIALPAQITWSMPYSDRVEDIMKTLSDVGVGVTSIAQIQAILTAAIIADRNTARVNLSEGGGLRDV